MSQDHAYALPLGYMLEEYRIEGMLGSGGFGITYLAHDTHLNKRVAVKEYLPNDFAVRYAERTVGPKSSAEAGNYQWGLERFLEEAQVLAGFDHAHINRVHRRFQAHGTAYLVLEYISGETLSARLRRTKVLSPAEALRLFREMLSGLEVVHRQGYVHRDIKPGNIMLREEGSAVLLDFGAARQLVGQRSKSVTSLLTPGYAPIEQYDSKSSHVGPWSDFYALGVTAYCCVTGVSEGALLDATARMLLLSRGEAEQDMRPAIEAARGSYDRRLLRAIDGCMKVDGRERPRDVAALRALLGEGSGPVPPPDKDKGKDEHKDEGKNEGKDKGEPSPLVGIAVGAACVSVLGRWADHLALTVTGFVLCALCGLAYGVIRKGSSRPRRVATWAGAVGVLLLVLVLPWRLSSPPVSPAPVLAPGKAPPAADAPVPPLPRVAEEPGSLVLELSPSDARVILPDIELGYRSGMALPAGAYQVIVRKPGYEEFVGTVRIESGQRTSKRIVLAEQPGSLVLELEPSDARVILPDIELGYRSGMALPAGAYQVIVRKPGYEEFVGTVRIESGQRTSKRIVLAEQPGSLVLELSPSDARVILPDIGPRYRRDMELPAGEYQVIVRKAGYEEFVGTVRIESGERTRRSIVLRRARGAGRAVGAVFRDVLKGGGEGPEMVVLPTGSFRMGDLSGDGGSDESPVRTVTIGRRIAMGRYEVTFADYDRFVLATGRERPDDMGWGRGRRPVIKVSWEDAKAYASWLSEQTGKRYRLPSESEWEYAARAGTSTRYSWGDEIGVNRANCDGCGSEWGNEQTSPVGSFEPNAFGLYDMHGNVWEWVEDCYVDTYTGAPSDGSARTTGCGSTTRAVLRGGAWYIYPRNLRAANRLWNSPSNRNNFNGFRLVQDLNP